MLNNTTLLSLIASKVILQRQHDKPIKFNIYSTDYLIVKTIAIVAAVLKIKGSSLTFQLVAFYGHLLGGVVTLRSN